MKLLILLLLTVGCTSLEKNSQIDRVGVFSGTFDPPHLAHMEITEQFIKRLDLDRLYLIVNPKSHHKKKTTLFKHRLNMSQLAFSKNKRIFVIDDQLIKAFSHKDMSGVLLEIRKRHQDARIIQIMGADSYKRFKKIRNKPKLKKYEVAVSYRDGMKPDIPKRDDIHATSYKLNLTKNVSSSRIRKNFKDSKVKLLLSPSVLKYIKKYELY